MTSSVPWTERLSTGTEAIQDDVVRWYQNTREGKAYVPTMIWGTLQTEAYATVILGQVVDFLGIPNDVPAGVAKRMQRQQVLYDGEHHYDVVLGEQALYTNIGGADVMRPQIERLLRELGLDSLTLGILPTTARVDLFPVHGFNIYGHGDRVNVELVSSSVDITEQSELDLYGKAFAALSSAASYGDAAEELLRKAHSFWTSAPPQGYHRSV
ncbi:Scr1 family TA system antitoxin-like transcriptional regulator [Streptomyces sp. NBC_00648]|uniref:Scr1 family TA system antitoxin-like transcriptional regulator n=1 Tax=Streptomyces sp. NBC_00648 TaxID=2975797 RepID=UPI00324B01CE